MKKLIALLLAGCMMAAMITGCGAKEEAAEAPAAAAEETAEAESDLAYCLHTIFQNQHIMPGVIMGLRAPNDPIPYGERAFMFASTKYAIMKGDTPVKLRNFSKQKKDSGGKS